MAVVARRDTVLALRERGLSRTGIFGDYYAGPDEFSACESVDEIHEKSYDYALVCTKSFDSEGAAKDLYEHASLFAENARVVLFQNGWGNAEVFLSLFDEKCIYSARVITGFRRHRKSDVTVTVHADSIHIGSLFGHDPLRVEDLCRSIAAGGIPCRTTDEIGKDLWAKMLYNCALNPLGAILDVPYGELAGREFTREIMNGIIEEVFSVMTSAGYDTHWQSAEDFIEVFYGRLVPDTAEHKSSTLQDISAKKRTEIDALNGAVVKLARQYGVKVPYNLVVYDLVRFIEARNF